MQENNQESPSSNVKKDRKKNFATAIPIKAFFRACLHNWYWFVISVIAVGCLAFLYSKSQMQQYSASA